MDVDEVELLLLSNLLIFSETGSGDGTHLLYRSLSSIIGLSLHFPLALKFSGPL